MTERKPLPPRPDPEQSLKQRLATALANESIGATELAALIAECEQAMGEVALEKDATYDPRRSPGAREALPRPEDCESRYTMLRTFLTALQLQYQHVVAAERSACCQAAYEVIKAKRDALAMEFRQNYPELAGQLIDLLYRIGINNADISDFHRAYSDSQRLLGAELVARGIREFNRDTPSIAQELRIPDWNNAATMAWPPPRQRDFSVLTATHDPRYSRDWDSPEVQAKREVAARAENERIGKWYEEQTRSQEERQNREERERFAQRRG